MQREFSVLLKFLPIPLSKALTNVFQNDAFSIEEIRLRVNQPIMLYQGTRGYFITTEGRLQTGITIGMTADYEMIKNTFDRLCESSVYAKQEQIRQGFLTIEGGHRVGIAGTTVVKEGSVSHIKELNGLNIRVARQVIGAADRVMPHIKRGEHIFHTLVLSPPGYGKTTILRDIARQLSSHPIIGHKVGIVDERGEITACVNGCPSFDVGIQTDILDRCPKSIGMSMMIRALSPEVIITDEIGNKQDLLALREAVASGVTLITSAHAGSMEELYCRPAMRDILNENIFERFVMLHQNHGLFTVLNREREQICG